MKTELTLKRTDGPLSLEEIRAQWLDSEAGTKPLKPYPRNELAELEGYWQVSMSQMGFRIQRLRELLEGLAGTEQSIELLSKLEKEFNLCTEIGLRAFHVSGCK
jgi:hypothetical protein